MQRKHWFIGLLLLVLTAVLLTPSLLRAVPSRYLARLPQPLQEIGAPEPESAILPTVAITADVSALLLATDVPSTPTPIVPPTYTAIPTDLATDQPTPEPSATLPPSPTIPPSPTPFPIPNTARLEGIQHKFQSWNNCGPATLAMTLSYFNLNQSQEQTAVFLKPNPEDRNVSPHEMVAYVQENTELSAIWRVNGRQATLKRLIANGIPVIVEIGIEPPGDYRWMGWYGHYLLIVAYADSQRQYWVYDSWFGTSEEPLQNANSEGRVLTYADVETYWPHFNNNYIAVYQPEQAELVADIVGAEMDTQLMWQNSLNNAQLKASNNAQNAFYWFNMGTSYNALGDYEKAAIAFDQALAIGLPWRMLWYQFGPYEAYYQTGRYEDVVTLADTTLDNRPYFEESFYYRGLAQQQLGNVRSARNDLERALSFNPNLTAAQLALESME